MSRFRSVLVLLLGCFWLVACDNKETIKLPTQESQTKAPEPRVGLSQAHYRSNGDLRFRLSTLESQVPLVVVTVEVRDKTRRPFYTYNLDTLRSLPVSWTKVTQGGPTKTTEEGLEIPPKTLVEFSLRPNFETKVPRDEYSLEIRDKDGHSYDLPLPLSSGP